MSRRLRRQRRYIDPRDFRDLRRQSGMTRKQAADALDVTPRTIQNWENGGARVPWMAFRMLRILRGYALPGVEWEGWTVTAGELVSPAGHRFDAASLQYLENVFSMARLWRQMYAESGRRKIAERVVPFPVRKRSLPAVDRPGSVTEIRPLDPGLDRDLLQTPLRNRTGGASR